MTVKIKNNVQTVATAMANAMRSDDPEVQAQAWADFHESLTSRIKQDFEDFKQTNDDAILAERGYRQLTSTETKWYQHLANALKSANPRQSFADIIGTDLEDDLMPETILEDVYRNLQEAHPLLEKVNFTYVKYATKWILNDHTAQKAVWGSITDAITKQITSGFKVVKVDQAKLSAYAFIERDMLDLGPTFLDAYIRTVLEESIYGGLEYGIVCGTGVDEPVGIVRDIHEGVSFSTTDGYPKKGAIKVYKFDPTTYGALLANLATTEGGIARQFDSVALLCNQADYLIKIMPATTQLRDGQYVGGLFPFPTEVIITNELASGEAAIGILGEYNAFAGAGRNGVIEFSDEFKFLDDVRYFKMVQHATGRAFDNTSFLRLDISELEPTYPTVNTIVGGGLKYFEPVTVKAAAADKVYWGHTVSDIQDGVAAGSSSIIGNLKYVASGSLPTTWGAGNFIALAFEKNDDRVTSIKVGVDPSVSAGLVELDEDMDAVCKISSKTQKFVVVQSDGTHTQTQVFDLSGLTLTPAI